MKYFETHCHLDFNDYRKDLDEVIKRSMKQGVEYFVNIGVDELSIKNSIRLAEKYPQFYATVGFHPNDAKDYNEEVLLEFIKHPKVVAVGEVGLDYYRERTPREIQKKVFIKQIEIAKKYDLPLVIHNRNSDQDCWDILSEQDPKDVVFHCYSGDLLLAEKIWEKGWYISFTCAVTYPKSNLNEVIRMAPIDKIMIETDSPFLPPQHIRGKRNDPSNLRYALEKLSEVRREPPIRLANALFENSCRFFLRKSLNK
ncbi:MAG: TatD family hydrolase [Candidatus Cloacimonadia bacterium]